jgi:hypothetical protein
VQIISKIQQLLNESKFFEAQMSCELEFQKKNSTFEIRELYFESLLKQNKIIPADLLIEHIQGLTPDRNFNQQLLLYQIELAEKNGNLGELYELITHLFSLRIKLHTPHFPQVCLEFSRKYFKGDFFLQLQELALDLLLLDLTQAEMKLKSLLHSCNERSSAKSSRQKIQGIYELLNSQVKLYHLEIYKNLCQLLINGISEKKDYKKIIEMIIFFDDFDMQVLVLDLMQKNRLQEVALSYAAIIKKNPQYNFVYLDKYFPDLKSFFFTEVREKKPVKLPEKEVEKMTPAPRVLFDSGPSEMIVKTQDEQLLEFYLLHSGHSLSELLEIAVSFIQLEMYYVAHFALKLAEKSVASNEDRLRCLYLQVTSLLKIGDYRGALDTSLGALGLAVTQDDVLCFLYAQAEAYLKLNQWSDAKEVLTKILRIDSSYRLAKERLDKLNAI